MRRAWAVTAIGLSPCAAVVWSEVGAVEAAMTLLVPTAFLVAGACGPWLAAAPVATWIWSVGAFHASALALSALALGSGNAWLHSASQLLFALGFGSLAIIAAGFPRGRVGRSWYAVVGVAAVLPLLGALSAPTPTVLRAETTMGPLTRVLPEPASWLAPGFFLLAPVAALTFIVRYRRHPGLRAAMRWPLLGTLVLSGLLLSGAALKSAAPALTDVAFLLAAPVLPVTLLLGAAQRPLPDVDRLLRRTAVFGGSWTLAAAAYGVGAAASAWAAATRSLVATIFLGALVSVLLAAPVRRRLIALADERARLLADLEQKVIELAESRRRLVTAAERERLRIERDLHDGVQQEVLALMTTVELCRARGLPQKEADALAQQARGLYERLREVSQGIRPAVLEDRGLLAAVDTLARQCTVPTTVSGSDHRWSGEVEGALYFVVAEALTNIAKHSEASAATICVSHHGVEVRDDGHGRVDPSRGTGLRGLTDRLEAVGATLEIRRERGWTVIAARVAL